MSLARERTSHLARECMVGGRLGTPGRTGTVVAACSSRLKLIAPGLRKGHVRATETREVQHSSFDGIAYYVLGRKIVRVRGGRNHGAVRARKRIQVPQQRGDVMSITRGGNMSIMWRVDMSFHLNDRMPPGCPSGVSSGVSSCCPTVACTAQRPRNHLAFARRVTGRIPSRHRKRALLLLLLLESVLPAGGSARVEGLRAQGELQQGLSKGAAGLACVASLRVCVGARRLPGGAREAHPIREERGQGEGADEVVRIRKVLVEDVEKELCDTARSTARGVKSSLAEGGR